MPLRVTDSNATTVYEDSTEKVVRFQSSRARSLDTFHKFSAAKVVVPASLTPPVSEVVPLGDFSAAAGDEVRGWVVEFDQDCELLADFGAGSVTIPLRRPGAAGSWGVLRIDATLVSLSVQYSADGSQPNVPNLCVTVGAWGADSPV